MFPRERRRMLDRLKTKCENLTAFLPADLFICGEGLREPVRFSKLHAPYFLERQIEASVKQAHALCGTTAHEAHLHADALRMCYLTWLAQEGGQGRFTVTLGPFIMERLTSDEVRYLGYKKKLGSDNCVILESFFGVLPFYDDTTLTRLVSVVSDCLSAVSDPPRIVPRGGASAPPAPEPVAEEDFETLSFVEENYAGEAKLMRAVEQGDTEFIRMIFRANQALVNLPPRYPSDPLREIKNLSITLNSLCVRAAINGGLSQSIAHNMSHNLAIRIEQQTSAEAMRGLLAQITLGYAEAVKKYALKDYSELVINTMHYIRRHMTSRLSLGEIAMEQHVSKEHLCRRFTKETHMTVTDFIHKTKVQASCELLASHWYGIGDIAFTMGYSSPSHFTKTFEKYMGMPPKRWQGLRSQNAPPSFEAT